MKQFFQMLLFRRFGYLAGIILLCGSVIFMGCAPASASSEAKITSFEFEATNNSTLSSDVVGSISDTSITLVVPLDADKSSLIASFTASAGATVSVNGTEQVSGTTANDFTTEVIYTVTAEDGTTKTSYTITLEFPVTEIAKKASTDVRDSYVLFSISNDTEFTDYHLAVKSGETAPTAAEMTAGALKRNIGPTAINVLIAQKLDAPIVTFAKTHFADSTHQSKTLGTGMSYIAPGQGTPDTADDGFIGFIADDTATGSDAWISQSLLEPATSYTLYGMANGGSSVVALLDFTTDAQAAQTAGTSTGGDSLSVSLVDTTLSNGHIEITYNPNDYYIFPMQVDSTASNITVYYLEIDSAIVYGVTLGSPFTDFGRVPDGARILTLVNNRRGTLLSDIQKGIAFMLYPTASYVTSRSAISPQGKYDTGTEATISPTFSKLVKQQAASTGN
ncbi:MAG: hypothetical protein B0D92_01120 [Spirochaeta sp. LUC14_002_19_P3]|nr:MAG: hypothetical protein B0D92_01120 [Spirochaeta sp. LUC14_002_19_P3]